MQSEVQFLGIVISDEGISVDPSKIKAIKTWPAHKSITEVRSFHGLTSFYERFIQGFSSVMTPVTECMKKGEFKWSERALSSFEETKKLLCNSLVLILQDFNKLFEVNCDASRVGIGTMLMKGHKLVAYFTENKFIQGKDNVVDDALSRRYIMLSFMEQKVL
ncbi:putative mitochondrial protein AtMg00860 [Silene latifolia]|uniref:putative mitochondrial protein AtMg00860 n=1 Tax=Silene latifolia TaxID=37657 RepID=UPI003D78A5FB